MLDVNIILSLLALGIMVGLLAGLLGVGGGAVIVPVLLWMLHYCPDIPSSSIMHVALGSSLATIMFTSLSSVIAHNKRGAIMWAVALRLAPGLVVGVLAGSVLAGSLSSRALMMFFSIFLLISATQLGFGAQPAAHRQLPGLPGTMLAGSIIGSLSALVGIGGGAMIVPFLVWCNVAVRNAVATSAACGFPIAVAGTVGYIISGWHEHLEFSTGYVYWPAVLVIVSASLFTAPLGAKLSHSVPVDVLKKCFAVFLALVGMKMLAG